MPDGTLLKVVVPAPVALLITGELQELDEQTSILEVYICYEPSND